MNSRLPLLGGERRDTIITSKVSGCVDGVPHNAQVVGLLLLRTRPIGRVRKRRRPSCAAIGSALRRMLLVLSTNEEGDRWLGPRAEPAAGMKGRHAPDRGVLDEEPEEDLCSR